MQLLHALLALAVLAGPAHSQAPGDADTVCTVTLAEQQPVYPSNIKVLMDSANYQNLIATTTTSPGPVWQTVDVDEIDTMTVRVSWTETQSFGCEHQLEVCGFTEPDQDNWLITQHINRTLPGGDRLEQVEVSVNYRFVGCTAGQCSASFKVYKYDTSTIDPAASGNINNFGGMPVAVVAPTDQLGGVQTQTISLMYSSTDTDSGFYLAIRDQNSCLTISRILVFYYVCPNEARNLVQFDELLAPPNIPQSEAISVIAQCIPNASPVSPTQQVKVICGDEGVWQVLPDFRCECDSGMQPNNNGSECIGCPAGQYITNTSQCMPCPNNTNMTFVNVEACPCLPTYFRAASDDPGRECTRSPSPPRSLVVTGGPTNTSITLSWVPPTGDGGRPADVITYGFHARPVGEDDIVTLGYMNKTNGTAEGLFPFTDYDVFVSSENGVSRLDPDIPGRSVSVRTKTQIGVPSVIAEDSIGIEGNTLSWAAPKYPGGTLTYYEIVFFSTNETQVASRAGQGPEVSRRTVGPDSTQYDVSQAGLGDGDYFVQIRAGTMTGAGEFSSPVLITIKDTGRPINLVVIIIPVLAVIAIAILIVAIILLGAFLCYKRGIKKTHQMYTYQDQIELPQARHRMYVDPSVYASPDAALQEFATEIPPKSIRLLEEIGAGEFGTVYKGLWKDGKESNQVAIKTLKPSSNHKMRGDFLNEAAIMAQFDHANVVKLYGVVTRVDPNMIVMEFLDNGSLYSYLRRHDEKLNHVRLVNMAKCVADGMAYLSEVGYVHRDLAARNILVARNEECKVADFGLSREVVDDEYDVKKGGKIPVRWTAPEAIAYRKFNTSSDVWSYGVLLWEIMSYAQHPYEFEDWDNQTVLNKLEEGYRLRTPKDCPDEIYQAMLQCWNADHLQRPAFGQIVTYFDGLLDQKTNGSVRPPKKPDSARYMSPLQFVTVEEWLKAIKMEQYAKTLADNNITTVNKCMQLTRNQLENMGVTVAGHLRKITASIDVGQGELIRQASTRI